MLQGYSERFSRLGATTHRIDAWLAAAAAAHKQPPADALATLVRHMRTALAADHVIIYKYTAAAQHWAVAPPAHWVQQSVGSAHSSAGDLAGNEARSAAAVGRGIAGCVAATGKTARIADVKASPLYDADVDDILVPQASQAVHSALAVRAADPGNAGSGAVVKAMRGWQHPAHAFSADDVAQAQWCASAAAQVCSAPCAYARSIPAHFRRMGGQAC